MLRIPAALVELPRPGSREELHERPMYRRFLGLEYAARMPAETTILRFRHIVERHAWNRRCWLP